MLCGLKQMPVAVLGALAAVAMFAAIAGSSAAAPGARPDHAAIVAYWTPERIAHAVPRDVSPKGFRPQAKPPGAGGGGGGGGGGTSVTGAAWTGGGAVKARTGKVLFTMGGVDYVCSGAVADDGGTQGRSLILTAGHCVYDETNRAFAENWMFAPDYEAGGSIVTNPDGSHSFTCDTVPYGCWTAEYLVTTTAWANGGGSLAGFNGDYAFAVVEGGGTSGSSQLDATVGSTSVAFDRSHPTQVYSFGYPHASPYDGKKLVYCAGKDVADTWGGTSDFGLQCNMTGGSSGGPWYVDFGAAGGEGSLNSVNSFKYTAGRMTKYMFGPYFDDYTQKTFTAAKTATDDLKVSP